MFSGLLQASLAKTYGLAVLGAPAVAHGGGNSRLDRISPQQISSLTGRYALVLLGWTSQGFAGPAFDGAGTPQGPKYYDKVQNQANRPLCCQG